METYDTRSGFSELDGTMEVSSGIVISYTNLNSERGDLNPPDAPVTRFTVHFGGRAYHIKSNASPSGNGFNGRARRDGRPLDEERPLAEEPWSATASTAVPYEQSTSVSDEGTAAEAAAS